LRDALAAFRAKGKFAIAFSGSFGEFGPGTRPYYLATAFDEIWLQPLGSVGLIGFHTYTPFLREALDRIGVSAEFGRREEYKTAADFLTEPSMSAAQREEMEALLASFSNQVVRGIASARKLTEADVAGLVDRGPLLAEEAKAGGLIDRIGYRDQAVARAREKAGTGAEFVAASKYLRAAGKPHDSGDKIALIYASGLITQEGAGSGLSGNSEASARELTRAFRQAYRDSKVRAILFRIDSPGGSAVASETIWREVVRARERGKPVIVSMGNVAGSGGYYIAAPANKIVAEPGTLTGSIGVLAGKVVLSGLLEKLGIKGDKIERGANAGMFSEFENFSSTGRARLEKFLDATYAGFKQRVADGRHFTADRVEAVAKGRIWSGEDAKAKGLVDELGGYDVALRLAREAAKIPDNQPFNLTVFPRDRGSIETIYQRLFESDHDTDAPPSSLARMISKLDDVLTGIGALAGDSATLRMPPMGEIR